MDFGSFQDPAFIRFWYAINIVAFATWILTLIHKNYSQVDRIWPIIPCVSAWSFVYTAIKYNPGPTDDVEIDSEVKSDDLQKGLGKSYVLEGTNSSHLRLIIMASFITLWCCRLVYNFWRKGGYTRGHEDYRWFYVKKMFSYPEVKWKFHLLNFVFIAFIQCWLLFGLTFSMWFAQTNKSTRNTHRQESFNWLDIVLSIIWVMFFTLEIVADKQQFKFQTRKYSYLAMSLKNKKMFKESSTDEEMADIKRGFLTRGLFSYSRHPNFFGEIGMWWTIAAFSFSSQLSFIQRNFNAWKLLPFNYAFIGIISLTMLFHESTKLTEKITSSKYHDYKQYKSRVNRLVLWFPGTMEKAQNKKD